jgi:hypothetical protein
MEMTSEGVFFCAPLLNFSAAVIDRCYFFSSEFGHRPSLARVCLSVSDESPRWMKGVR